MSAQESQRRQQAHNEDHAADVRRENAELFSAKETPFNLAGELIDNAPTEEGEKRAKAEAQYAQEKAQRSFFECGGTFDGFSCGTDADPGL